VKKWVVVGWHMPSKRKNSHVSQNPVTDQRGLKPPAATDGGDSRAVYNFFFGRKIVTESGNPVEPQKTLK
jgi:hypothetical protein